MSDKLKPCPFCGEAVEMMVAQFGMEKFKRYGVPCKACGYTIGWEESEEAMAERWNRRATETIVNNGTMNITM